MSRKDLVVLVADKDMEHALKGIFERPKALGIRTIEPEILVEAQHDAACAQRGVPFLSMFSTDYHYGLLMFDHKGSGREQISPQELQEDLNAEFRRTGWEERAKAVVLAPELEAWVWGASYPTGDLNGSAVRSISSRSRWRCSDTIPSYAPR